MAPIFCGVASRFACQNVGDYDRKAQDFYLEHYKTLINLKVRVGTGRVSPMDSVSSLAGKRTTTQHAQQCQCDKPPWGGGRGGIRSVVSGFDIWPSMV